MLEPAAARPLRRLLHTKEREQTTPLNDSPGEHFLNLVSAGTYFKSSAPLTEEEEEEQKEEPARTHVYATVEIKDVRGAEADTDGTFESRLEVYLFWPADFSSSELAPFVRHHSSACASRHGYISLREEEVTEMIHGVVVPTFTFANAIECEVEGAENHIRVYGGDGTHGGLMWNAGYACKFKQSYRLHTFPFDAHHLQIVMRQDDPSTWDLFDLTLAMVMFNGDALEMMEWTMCEPKVKRGSPAHKEAIVELVVKRQPGFFIINVVGLMLMISFTGFVIFMLPISDLNDRINILLTLLLTAVAFKFVIADSIPKVGYATILDKFVIVNMLFLFFQIFMVTIGHAAWPDDDDAQMSCGTASTDTATGETPGAYTPNANMYMSCVSFLLFLAMNGWWLLIVAMEIHSQSDLKELTKVEGKNYYSFAFCDAAFFPTDAEEEAVEAAEKVSEEREAILRMPEGPEKEKAKKRLNEDEKTAATLTQSKRKLRRRRSSTYGK